MIELNLNPPRKDLWLFSVLLIPFSFFVGWLLRSWGAESTTSWIINFVVAGVGLTGVIWPAAVRWLFVTWMIVVFPIGWLFSHIIMALIFYGVFLPIGLVARAFGYDPLGLKRSCETYWTAVEEVTDKERYFRQF